MSRSEWQGFGLVVASAAGFGLMAVMARAAYAGGATVPTLLFLRFAVGGAGLWAWLAWRRNLPVLSWRIWVALLLMGAAGYAGQSSLYFTALTRIPASLTAMLLYLYPLLVTLLGWLLLRQPISWAQAAALVSSLAGLGLMLWQAPPSVRYDPVGVVMGAGAALVYSFYILAGDRLLRRASPLHASAIVITGAAATFLIAGLATRSLHLSLTLPGWAGVLGLVLFGTLMAILAFLAGLERLGATRASIVSALEPVVTVLSAWALLGESLAARQLLGAGLVLAGALLVQLPSRQVATAAADDREAVRGGRERNSGRFFAGKTALVTGASSGIGRATALALMEAGATVVAFARSRGALDELAEAAPNRILPCVGDVTRPPDLAAAVQLALDATGHLDILVNNAGIGLNARVEETEPDWLRRCLEVNVVGSLNAIQAVLPVMRRQGAGQVINVASLAGRLPVPYSGGYSASKYALTALGEALRLENRTAGVQVVQVFPGSVATPFRRHALGRSLGPKPRPRRVTADRVARRILQASRRGERGAYVTWLDWLLSRLFAWVPGLSTSVLGWVYRRAERLERRAPATGQEGARTAVRRSAAAEPAGKSPEA